MNVTTARASPGGGGTCCATSIREGHGIRGSRMSFGTAVKGCGVSPPGLKNRLPSK
jgi:hypothetical protein